MKDAEDEAFDDLAKKQGDWGGGFKAKQAMAADKFIAAEERKVGERYGYVPKLHPSEWMNDHNEDNLDMVAQPAQKPVAWITPDGEGFRIRFSAPTNDVPLGWDALYTTPQQRPWVGLTGEDFSAIKFPVEMRFPAEFRAGARWAEDKLKEKNNGT
jgi:hypothetical protein